jgi:hypothetical protein
MIQSIKDILHAKPTWSILVIALVIRLCAAIFSPGYAMHDDHFLIIESSSSWAAGEDYNNWLPWNQEKAVAAGTRDSVHPEGHSLFYPGIQFVLFSTFQAIGISDPYWQMLLVRILHALLGVWTVYLTIQLSKRIGLSDYIIPIGLAAALGWSLPFLSVRNLVEMVCIPFFMQGLVFLSRNRTSDTFKHALFAGLFFGLAFAVRYQLAAFFGFLGLVILVERKWLSAIGVLIGFLLTAGITQGLIDYLIWGYPFAEFGEYIAYNLSDASKDYAQDLGNPLWIGYIFVLGTMVIPIVGLFWIFGFFRSIRKHAWLAVPTIAFVAFHAMYVNIQERFVFPVIFIVLILGVAGWETFRVQSNFWKKRTALWKGIRLTGWSLNILLLLLMTFTYTKRSRVESAYYLYGKDVNLVIQENTATGNTPMIPLFYTGNWKLSYFSIQTQEELEELDTYAGKAAVDYIFFYGEQNLSTRINQMRTYYPNLSYATTAHPSFFDYWLHKINPVNKNETITIYKTRKS